tara:strand:+ start:12453 stop:12755 length:303 start_codon:yes stop_codon:yes gene_type:complete
VYRKHVDGSWPEAFLDENGTYVVDNSNGKKRSRLTLLMYLSDGFLGGGLRFTAPYRAAQAKVRIGPFPNLNTVLPKLVTVVHTSRHTRLTLSFYLSQSAQ